MASLVFKNISWVLAGEILARVFQLLFILLIANYLGVSGFGFLSSAIAFFSLFNFLMDMGLYQLSVREIAKSKAKASSFTSYVLGLKLILSFFVFLVVISLAIISGYGPEFIAVCVVLGMFFIFESYVFSFFGVFQAFERLEYVAFVRVLTGATLLGFGLFSVYLGGDIMYIAFAYVFSIILSLLACSFLLTKYFFKPTVSFNLLVYQSLLRESWPFGFTLFLTSIMLSFDIVVISFFLGNVSVGLYSAASKMVIALSFIIAAFNQAVYPALSRLHSKKREFNGVFGFYLSSMLFLGVPMAILISLNAQDLISLFYKSDYLPAASVLSILIWGLFFGFLGSPFHRVLDAKGLQKTVFKYVLIACTLNVFLNILLVPKFGITGAAYASVIGYLTLLLFPAIVCIQKGFTPTVSTKNMLALTFATLFLIITQLLNFVFPLNLIISGVVYVIVFGILGGLKFIVSNTEFF